MSTETVSGVKCCLCRKTGSSKQAPEAERAASSGHSFQTPGTGARRGWTGKCRRSWSSKKVEKNMTHGLAVGERRGESARSSSSQAWELGERGLQKVSNEKRFCTVSFK